MTFKFVDLPTFATEPCTILTYMKLIIVDKQTQYSIFTWNVSLSTKD